MSALTTYPRKLEIFVGATSRDLGAARLAVIQAILGKGHIPSGMELWAAGNRPPLDEIARHLARCDAHIVLVGARYGSIIEGPDGHSFAEWEVRQSWGKRPILPFVFDHPTLVAARKAEKDPDERKPDQRQRLDRLRAALLRTRYVREFRIDRTGLEKLQKDAILALDELERSEELDDCAGWIRGDSPEARTGREVAANPFLRRELERLRKFSTLGRRVGLDVVSKRVMARRFWQEMQGRLRRQGWHHLFFESGSTVAYLTDEFEQAVLRADEESHPWQIRTNNVLAAVQFALHSPLEASRFPAGVPDPDDRYGAIFPHSWRALLEPVPKKPRALFPGEQMAVDEMRERFAGGPGRKQLVLATASGLDLDDREPAFRGPHVGSHPNMLFKRAILTAGDPVVLFLNAEKLGDPFRRGRCYPVFDPGLPWEQGVRDFPLAICVGYEWPKTSPSMPRIAPSDLEGRNQPGVIRSNLEDLGFEVTYFNDDIYRVSEPYEGGAILMSNRKFAELVLGD